MIAVVMTAYDREYQLNKTLESLNSHNDFHVIIVDDDSPSVPELIKTPFPVTMLRTKDKRWINPEPAYNVGIDYALKLNPDVIIIQNGECYHVGDVIGHAAGVGQDEVISYACYSIDKDTTFSDHNIHRVISDNNFGASRDGQNAWYNHPEHRPVGYDFCMAMKADNMRKLGGHDERFSSGCGYGDNYLLHRIKLLGLRLTIEPIPFVVHQWHYGNTVPADKPYLVQRNKNLFEALQKTPTIKAERIYHTDYEIYLINN